MLFLVFIKDWFFFKQIICMPVVPRQYNPDLRGNLSCLKMFFLANGLHILIYIYIYLLAHKIYISSNECTKSFKNVFGF